MNKPKENKLVPNEEVIKYLNRTLSIYKIDELVCVKNKKIFKGEYFVDFPKSKKILFLIQTQEIHIHIAKLQDDTVVKSAMVKLKFTSKNKSKPFKIKNLVVSFDEKLIAFVGKEHIAISQISDLEASKENCTFQFFIVS
jgi:hypothetical protein